jgi:hypothetical protein
MPQNDTKKWLSAYWYRNAGSHTEPSGYGVFVELSELIYCNAFVSVGDVPKGIATLNGIINQTFFYG